MCLSNLFVLEVTQLLRGGDSMSRPLADVGSKAGAILVVLALFVFVFPLFFTSNVMAADDDQFLWGMIFDSDGNALPYDTNFRVWVEHNSTWHGFPSNTTWDPVGTMGGFYSYTLPWDQKEINWSDADQYRLQIDCTPSGDMAENATSNGTGSAGDPISPMGSYNNEINWLTGGGLNNSQQWDVMCSNVDLIPISIELNGQPYSPPMAVAPFSTVTFSAFVTNTGKTDIAEPNTIVLRNQSGVLQQDTAIFVNSSTSVGPYILTWNAPASGYFCFNITVDYNDNVTETNENNNSEMVCFSVGEADLTPTGVGITTDYGTQFYLDVSATNYRSNPIPITPGTTATIVTNVTNVGTLSSGPSDLAFYETQWEGGPIQGVPFYIPMVGALNPGLDDGPFVTNWLAPLIHGYYYVEITADYNSDVNEINELNNTFILRFLVGKPDYIPWNPALPLVQDVTSATSVPIDAFVSNVDLLDALTNSTIAFYNQTNPMDPFGTNNVTAIGAGLTSAISYSATWTAPIVAVMTTYFVVIEVDYDGDIAESNELNNTLVIQFNVFPGPVTTLTYGDPSYVNGTTLYVTSSTTLDFIVQSPVVSYTHYSLDGGASVNYSSTGTFTIPSEGLHNLTFYSVDSLGNTEQTRAQTIIVDDSPPITELNIFGRKFTSAGTTWVRSNTAITPIYLNWTRDDEPTMAVGRERTSYRVFRVVWGAWTDFIPGNPIDLGITDGLREIEWFSVDRLGNNETVRMVAVVVDDTPPTTTIVLGDPNFDRDGALFIEKTSEITLSATDGGSGLNAIQYRLDDDTAWSPYLGPFTIETFGEHTVYFRSVDNLGNTEQEQEEDVFVLGPNFKPILAIIFIIIMIIVGAVVGYKRPLIMTRKKQREFEEALLKEEEETELEDDDIEEEFEEYQEEVVEEVEEFEDEPVEEPEEFGEEVEEFQEEDVQEEVQDKDNGIIDLSDRRVV
jgi:hypothetical protein